MSDLVEQLLRPHRERLAEIVGETVTPLHRMSLLETSMDNLITDAYLNLTGAEVAFSHGWRYGAPVLSGPVSTSDLWQIIPTNPEVFTAELTREQIRQMLEQSFEDVYAMPRCDKREGTRSEFLVFPPWFARTIHMARESRSCISLAKRIGRLSASE